MSTENTEQPGQGSSEALSSAAIARRHALLKGLSRGSVVLAASTPIVAAAQINTLAPKTVLTYNNRVCSISGWQSVVTQASRLDGAPICESYSPGWWGQKNNDNPLVPRRTWPIDFNKPYTDYFKKAWETIALVPYKAAIAAKGGKPAIPAVPAHVPSLFEIQGLPQYSNTQLRHWMCAWLNALDATPQTANFPYSADKVMIYYNNNDQNALTFFKNYLEHPPSGSP